MATTNNKQVKYRKGAVVRFADTPESIAKLEKLGYKVDEGKKAATANKDDKKAAANKDDKKESNKPDDTEK